jgi:hypothetical protein
VAEDPRTALGPRDALARLDVIVLPSLDAMNCAKPFAELELGSSSTRAQPDIGRARSASSRALCEIERGA